MCLQGPPHCQIESKRNGVIWGVRRSVQPEPHSILRKVIHLAVWTYVHRSKVRNLRNRKRICPCHSTIRGKGEITIARRRHPLPGLVNRSMPGLGVVSIVIHDLSPPCAGATSNHLARRLLNAKCRSIRIRVVQAQIIKPSLASVARTGSLRKTLVCSVPPKVTRFRRSSKTHSQPGGNCCSCCQTVARQSRSDLDCSDQCTSMLHWQRLPPYFARPTR